MDCNIKSMRPILEKRIARLEALFPKPRGTQLSHGLAGKGGSLWTVCFGPLDGPFGFTGKGKTLSGAIHEAEQLVIRQWQTINAKKHAGMSVDGAEFKRLHDWMAVYVEHLPEMSKRDKALLAKRATKLSF